MQIYDDDADYDVIEAEVTEENMNGERLDTFLTEYMSDYCTFSRSQIQKLIKDGRVLLNDKEVKSNTKIKTGDRYRIEYKEPGEITAEAEDIPLDIVYEDKDIVVVNKRRGMVVHPAAGNYTGTLVNALLYHCSDLSDIGGVIRPGIVHRLDKDTTGLMVVAKNNNAHLFLSEQIKERKVSRLYMALVEGELPENKGMVDAAIGRHKNDRKKMAVDIKDGRRAVTHYSVIKRYHGFTLLECALETGRTHQIRVHLSYIGYPVVGDSVYGKKDTRQMQGQALHAYKLILTHPVTKETMTFTAPLPDDFNELLERI